MKRGGQRAEAALSSRLIFEQFQIRYLISYQPGTLSAELVLEEPEAAPEEFAELPEVPELLELPEEPVPELLLEPELLFEPEPELTDEFVPELELLDELEPDPPAVPEPLVFDVEESELSCSVPLLAQPVKAVAISANATTEVISFFIFYSLS